MLFLIILIALIYIHIYLTYNNSIESFTTDVLSELPTGTGNTDVQSNTISITSTMGGSVIGDPAPNAIHISNLHLQQRGVSSTGETAIQYSNGYYFIRIGKPNLPITQLTFCLIDKKYYGGGWMLAMRSVKGSTRFKFDSRYWYTDDKYNANLTDVERLKNNLESTQSANYNISSIGNLIYDKPASMTNEQYSDTYDFKSEIFNTYPVTECLIIFYKKDGSNFVAGGDTNENNTINTWTWYQTGLNPGNIAENDKKPLLQIFRDFYTWGRNNLNDDFSIATPVAQPGGRLGFSIGKVLRSFENLSEFQNFPKLKKSPPGSPDQLIWPSIIRTNRDEIFHQGVYALNFHTSSTNGLRWGFMLATSGIGDGFGIGAQNSSCSNSSIAFELYVR